VTGTFGSELLRGIRAFKPVEPTPGVYQPEVMPHVRAAHHTYQRMLRGHPLSFALFQQAPWHHGGLLGLEHTQLAVRAPFLDNDLVRLVFRAPVRPRARTEICLRLVADGNPALRRIPTDRGEGGSRGLATALSRQWRALEFKAEYHLGDRMPQRLARFAGFGPLRGWETPWLGRHKFQHFRLWYRSELAAYVRDVLLDPRALSRSYLQRRAVERIVRDHLRGVRNCTAELHRLLTLELCHRLFLDGPARGAGHAESPGTG
jgi:asparagine synthase (glutamine-hydrolysing)